MPSPKRKNSVPSSRYNCISTRRLASPRPYPSPSSAQPHRRRSDRRQRQKCEGLEAHQKCRVMGRSSMLSSSATSIISAPSYLKNYNPSDTHVTSPQPQYSSTTNEFDWVSCQFLFQSQPCRTDTNLSALRHSRSHHPHLHQRPLPHGLLPRNRGLCMRTTVDLPMALKTGSVSTRILLLGIVVSLGIGYWGEHIGVSPAFFVGVRAVPQLLNVFIGVSIREHDYVRSRKGIREEYREPCRGKACDEKGWVIVKSKETSKDK